MIPTMNEEASIGLVMDEVRTALEGVRPFEVIVVDTDSKDRTRAIAAEKGAVVVPEPRRPSVSPTRRLAAPAAPG